MQFTRLGVKVLNKCVCMLISRLNICDADNFLFHGAMDNVMFDVDVAGSPAAVIVLSVLHNKDEAALHHVRHEILHLAKEFHFVVHDFCECDVLRRG